MGQILRTYKYKSDKMEYRKKFKNNFSFSRKTYTRLLKFCENNNIDVNTIKDKDYFYTTNSLKIDKIILIRAGEEL